MVLSRRVDFPIDKNAISRWKYSHKKIEKIICVSDKIKEIVQNSVKDHNKSITIYSGIDLGKFKFENSGYLRKKYSLR